MRLISIEEAIRLTGFALSAVRDMVETRPGDRWLLVYKSRVDGRILAETTETSDRAGLIALSEIDMFEPIAIVDRQTSRVHRANLRITWVECS